VEPSGEGEVPGLASGKPNILMLIVDDQAFRLFTRQYMPEVFSRLVDQGVWFDRNYVNDSQCCPSRASILTGLYAHDTGVDSNFRPLDGRTPARPTFVRTLHDAGYRTMLAGKYLNSESCDPQPGWDRWVCGQDKTMTEVDPVLTIAGVTSTVKGYTADILADQAIDFTRQNDDPAHPFFVYYAPTDPHLPANDPRASTLPVPAYRPPSYNVQPDPLTKPRWTRLPPLSGQMQREVDAWHTRMARQLPPLDADIGRILDAVEARAADTLVIFMSDNGFLYGEHRMTDKTQPYEESVRVPLVIRYPRALAPAKHFVSHALTENTDLAPTVMDAAGIAWEADGTSLLPILKGTTPTVHPQGVLTEWCQAGLGPCPSFATGPPPHYWALETDRYVYIEYATGETELYDLERDPFELTNLAGVPSDRNLGERLATQLGALRAPPATPGTTIAVGPVGAAPAGQVSFEFFSQARTTTFACRLEGPGQSGVTAPCPSGRVTYGPLGAGRYTFIVVATDAAGHRDATPATRAFTVTG
jgi:N-acetylglucosamine-6-sulfatase